MPQVLSTPWGAFTEGELMREIGPPGGIIHCDRYGVPYDTAALYEAAQKLWARRQRAKAEDASKQLSYQLQADGIYPPPVHHFWLGADA